MISMTGVVASLKNLEHILSSFCRTIESVVLSAEKLERLVSESMSDLTLEDTISWFSTQRAVVADAAMGCLLRQKLDRNIIIYQVCLTCDGDIANGLDGRPAGRSIMLPRLNSEMKEIFGDRDLVLFR